MRVCVCVCVCVHAIMRVHAYNVCFCERALERQSIELSMGRRGGMRKDNQERDADGQQMEEEIGRGVKRKVILREVNIISLPCP